MRAIAVLVALMVGASAMAQSGAPADVPKDHWAFSAVDNLFKAGILKGYPDGSFKGSRPATRFEMAGMLNNLVSQDKTADLKRQVDNLKAQPKGEVSKADTEQLRTQIESLRASVLAMRRQREDIDGLSATFQSLHEQLQKMRSDVDGMRRDLSVVNGKVKGN